MITWAAFPFVRYTPALIAGIVAYLYLGAGWPELWPYAAAMAVLAAVLIFWSVRQHTSAVTDAAGLLALCTVVVLGATLTQRATESRRADHLSRFADQVTSYQAVVDDYTVVRAATYATTLRVQAVRVAGRWRQATGGVRVSLPRVAGVAQPRYGEVWLIRGHPDLSKPPLNPGEFDYRRYLEFRQVYHQQYIHPDQYRVLRMEPPNVLVAISMRAAAQLDEVFRHYIKARREYAIASALVLGIKDDVDLATKQAYTNTGTTHIMAVSGLQVGLLFAAMSWLLGALFGRVRGFRTWSALVGLVVIWSYAFLTGLSASVLRATVMFTFVILGRATGRQSTIFNTLAVAAFALLVFNPFLVADVGFQLSFLAVLSIVYLQPRIARWLDVETYFYARRRPWQPRALQWSWRGSGWFLDKVWQATALSLAAQVATFGLGLFYFHQFPLSFLFSNLVAVPISSGAVYVGLGLLGLKGLTAVLGALLPTDAAAWLDMLPRLVAWVFEGMVWAFNEYIFWVSRIMSGWVIREIHVTALQTVLLFGLIGALLAWANTRRLGWLRGAAGILLVYAGTRVAEARTVAPTEEFIVYSIPRRSAVGFWQGSAAEFVTPDSLPLNETERTYRLLPGLIQRQARQPAYSVGWRGATVPVQRLADPDSANDRLFLKPGPVVLARWRGLRIAFVSNRISSATEPAPVDVLVLRRNARLRPETVAAVFGPLVQVVFDSSCKIWYVARQDSLLRAAGFRTWDVTAQGAFRCPPPMVRQ
ncbi:ComEC/Rec2 family competence protein [Hymenobacter sp. BT770]|uniref:ComEC/Rec2 family competence protein n=1 Tax=Hymenobacter sp. BT770 TaxID=2886942 RepID=UPI001D0F4CEC|nr:ComEC/Rec2 family competence protein [Hymenobacter sp. BT770]MCC3153991.1 ComEC family competence protein [Hymenobacter sp. BT770]MDO3416079.1 ComEC/Rec2 family competence protein [Hymenobacter sp. BT770]